MKSVGIILLHWNAFEDTVDCIHSMLACESIEEDQIYLIDNHFCLDITDQATKLFPKIHVHRMNTNLGFSGGNNYAIRLLLGSRFKYILLINNDTVVEKDFLNFLIEGFRDSKDVGISVPKIKMYNNKNKLYFGGGGFNKISGRVRMYGLNKADGPEYSVQKEIDFANGCCLLIKKEVFEKIGLFDEAFFFYGEDADFSMRARKFGYKLVYCPRSVIYHKADLEYEKRESELYLFHLFRSIGMLFRRQRLELFRLIPHYYFALSIPYNVLKRILKANPKGARAILKGFFSN